MRARRGADDGQFPYWKSTNTAVYASAKSYIPEIPWNDSCASRLITTVLGFTVPYGASGSCNSGAGEGFLDTAAGSGGPSAWAYGTPTKPPTTSGTCQGYRKPSWQRGVYGNPNDGVRDLPDISLFAANGVWGHYYVLCYSDPAGGGGPCTGAPSTWAGAGGTSFVAPILAGVQALVKPALGTLPGESKLRILPAGRPGIRPPWKRGLQFDYRDRQGLHFP